MGFYLYRSMVMISRR